MIRLALALAALLALPGCPWDDPCWHRACGAGCTWCGADDVACQQAESAHACDDGGSCVPVGPAPGGAATCSPPR